MLQEILVLPWSVGKVRLRKLLIHIGQSMFIFLYSGGVLLWSPVMWVSEETLIASNAEYSIKMRNAASLFFNLTCGYWSPGNIFLAQLSISYNQMFEDKCHVSGFFVFYKNPINKTFQKQMCCPYLLVAKQVLGFGAWGFMTCLCHNSYQHLRCIRLFHFGSCTRIKSTNVKNVTARPVTLSSLAANPGAL